MEWRAAVARMLVVVGFVGWGCTSTGRTIDGVTPDGGVDVAEVDAAEVDVAEVDAAEVDAAIDSSAPDGPPPTWDLTCAHSEPIVTIDRPLVTGDTRLASNSSDEWWDPLVRPACFSAVGPPGSAGQGPDILHAINTTVPLSRIDVAVTSQEWVAWTAGYDHDCSNDSCRTSTTRLGAYAIPVAARELFCGTSPASDLCWFAAAGPYWLYVHGTIAAGGSCADPLVAAGVIACTDGYTCGGLAGNPTCVRAACADGIDDDGDGKTDYPADPGCSSRSDDDERDACPTGPGCPACGNGQDDDGDGAVDFPADTSCRSASDDGELGCDHQDDHATRLTQPITTGTTLRSPDLVPNDPGVHILDLAVPVAHLTATVKVDLSGTTWSKGISASVRIMDRSCGTTLASGTKFEIVNTSALAAGRYAVLVDAAWIGGLGVDYALELTGEIAAGQSCDDPLVATGVLACASGYTCRGPAGARTCQVATCNDGVDDDGDGRTDYPADPGCATPSSMSEVDACPGGPGCAACSDGLDNDGDGLTDYPADPNCTAAGDDEELGCGLITNDVTRITQPTTIGFVGTAYGDANTFTQDASATSPDKFFALDVTVPLEQLSMSWLGFPLSLFEPQSASVFFVNDDCTTFSHGDFYGMDVTNVAPRRFVFVVNNHAHNDFRITVRGTIAVGGSCDDPLVATGVFTCAAGSTCQGSPGAATCVAP